MATIKELKELALHAARGTAPANFSAETVDEALRSELASMCDSINNFIKLYNAEKQYDFILSNAGFDNLLYGNPAFNITGEIIEGLNKRYNK